MIDRICSLLKTQKPELNRGLLSASGDVVPTITTDGYQTGCTFKHTDGGAGTALYVNVGSVTSCNFVALESASSLTISELADVGTTDYTAGEVLIADGDSFEQVAISQDATLASDGKLSVVSSVGSFDVGSSGAAGVLDIFPATGSKGKLAVSVTDQAGDTTVSLVVAEMAAARTINLPDPGATSYLMQSTAQISLAEADVLDAATAGTQVASKAVIANADVNIGVVKATELHIGATGSETQVTATAAELNVLDAVTAGTVAASKALVVDASRDLATLGALTVDGVLTMASQGSGVALTNAIPYGVEIHVKPTTDFVAPATGVSAGLYARYETGVDVTQNVGHAGLFGKLRVKKDLASGVHGGVYGYVEISEVGTVISGAASTITAAGVFAVETDTNFELSTGYLCGVCIDSSVNSGATISGTMAGVYIKKSSGAKAWPTGIKIDDDASETGLLIGTCTTGIQNTAGAANAAIAQRFGASTTEGLEIRVIDEVVTLTNAVETNLTETVPDTAVILSVQANNDTLVAGDASGDDGLTKVGIGVTGDPNKYGLTADLSQNTKVDTIPDWVVLSGAETVCVKAADNAGVAVTEKFVAGGEVRVRIVYLMTNSLDDTA